MQGDRTDSPRSNEIAVKAAIDYLGLPSTTVRPRADVVHVTVVDAAELNRWHYELGGLITSTASGDGVALWTLVTKSPTRGDGSTVPIRVHAIIPEGDDVLIEVRRSEAAA